MAGEPAQRQGLTGGTATRQINEGRQDAPSVDSSENGAVRVGLHLGAPLAAETTSSGKRLTHSRSKCILCIHDDKEYST